ncbi:SH3 domain-containing protein [Iodobacter sp. CM08]|uniref:SH3 domain-containing protein n=1 Tax=Iodobacter sp. CM08 TaxID=3085902 RepID=UPI002980CF3A|nr:SH3 domain-containing protein [Iodobacter sp. CM08]MDW5417767.1 SH3 domain-containing protein [Iodobacter sp. CM08]
MKKILLLLALSSTAWAEPASIIRNSDLREKPFLDAAIVGQLSAGNSVDVQARQGAWMQVKSSSNLIGWIKLLNVRTGNSTESSSGSGFGALAKVFTTGSSGSTVTTGVKGLSAEQIRNAQPNPEELNKLIGYSASSSDASRNAAKEQLIPQTVAYIPLDSQAAPSESNSSERRR